MSRSINSHTILGNVGKDPETRDTPSGTLIATFSVATSSRFKDAQGQWQVKSEWHNCTAFKRTAEIVRDYVHKGSKVYVKGPSQTESWDDKTTGQKRYKTSIIVNELILLSGKDEQNKASYSSGAQPADQQEISDDDIPF
jgi:single-strand DNA-binding protein